MLHVHPKKPSPFLHQDLITVILVKNILHILLQNLRVSLLLKDQIHHIHNNINISQLPRNLQNRQSHLIRRSLHTLRDSLHILPRLHRNTTARIRQIPDQGTLILLTLPHRIKTRDQKIISLEPPLDLRDLHHRHMLHFPKKSLFPRHHADTPHNRELQDITYLCHKSPYLLYKSLHFSIQGTIVNYVIS